MAAEGGATIRRPYDHPIHLHVRGLVPWVAGGERRFFFSCPDV